MTVNNFYDPVTYYDVLGGMIKPDVTSFELPRKCYSYVRYEIGHYYTVEEQVGLAVDAVRNHMIQHMAVENVKSDVENGIDSWKSLIAIYYLRAIHDLELHELKNNDIMKEVYKGFQLDDIVLGAVLEGLKRNPIRMITFMDGLVDSHNVVSWVRKYNGLDK